MTSAPPRFINSETDCILLRINFVPRNMAKSFSEFLRIWMLKSVGFIL